MCACERVNSFFFIFFARVMELINPLCLCQAAWPNVSHQYISGLLLRPAQTCRAEPGCLFIRVCVCECVCVCVSEILVYRHKAVNKGSSPRASVTSQRLCML